MADEIQEAVEDKAGEAPADPWAQAFAAIGKEAAEDAAGDAVQEEAMGNADTEVSDNGSGAAVDEAVDGQGDAGEHGEPGADRGVDGVQDEEPGGDMLGVSEEEIGSLRDGIRQDVRDRAIGDMAKAFIDRGIRHTNGKLGASLNDKDICKRDEDGVPRFYNPDTGREFTGDNPRRQAQEWVDDYNRELADAFNKACQNYEDKLMEAEEPRVRVLEFASTYDGLDPIRRSMFDNIVEDYEIRDGNGEIIGYSCDLNKALAAVNRQVAAIQSYSKAHAPAAGEQAASGPALDMKTSNGAMDGNGSKPQFKSLAEAMEYQQNKLLEDMKKKG